MSFCVVAALLGAGWLSTSHAGPPPRKSARSKPATAERRKTSDKKDGAKNGAKNNEQKKKDTSPPVTDLFGSSLTPLGHAGGRASPDDSGSTAPATPMPDRWRSGWPPWDRYGRQSAADPLLTNPFGGDVPYTRGHPANPYDRNVLKGDYPILGDDIFLNVTMTSDTTVTLRDLPTPSGVSASSAGAFDFFRDGEQVFVSQTFLLNLDLFRGYSVFRPVDWLVRLTPAANINYVELTEHNNVNVDVRDGDVRDDAFASLQEAFFEYHLGDTSPFFDIAALRVGRQQFNSDFRGFLYNDIGDGVRLLGNLASNRMQYNLALLTQNDKDTNSGLEEFDWKDQQVLIANLYVEDFIWMGYTTQVSFHWNHDQSDREFDDNDFLVIPDLAGSATPHDVDAYYAGWAGDGHIGRLNVNHAFYYAFGHDDDNPIAGRAVDLSALLAAAELSIDVDWFRPKVSVLYASGDDDPEDGRAEGFDGILDNPVFAGGPASFYHGQALRLFGVNLTSARSLYTDLAANKAEGQANFVNPGTLLLNAGFEAELTPKLKASFNYNHLRFAATETLELFLNQNDIDRHLGDEVNLVLQYRPLLNNNVIVTVGGSLFFPGDGFEDVFDSDETLYQVTTSLTLTY